MAAPATIEEKWIQSAVRRFEGPLIDYATKMVGKDRARDVVQDTFIRLMKQPREAVEDRLAAWLYTVCRNRALDLIRHESRMCALAPEVQERQPSRTPLPHDVCELRQETAVALSLVETLPKREQDLIRLKFQHGLSYREISDVTGLSVSNVGYLLHMSLKKLRAKMKTKGMVGRRQGDES